VKLKKEFSMEYETILYEKVDGIGIITLNRPDRMNALSRQLKEEVWSLFEAWEADDEVRVVILTGGEKVFSAGADIKERSRVQLTQSRFYTSQKKSQEFYTRIEQYEKPVMAAVSGLALGGGCELALVCDLRIASETARFGLPEVKLGSMPSAGGTQRLPRLIGAARAKEMLFSGDFVEAWEAHRIGLVNRVVPVDRLMPETWAWALRLAERPPLSLNYIKRAVQGGLGLDLPSALDYEVQCSSVLYVSEDRQEGIKAFAEKRKPVFKGR
jgi:enoyl-CoA hydratase